MRGRLSLGLAISLVALLALQWGVATVVIERLVERQLISRLTQDAESLLAGINFENQHNFVLDPARVSAVYQRPFSGHYYVISTESQKESSRSLWDGLLEIPYLEAGQQVLLRAHDPQRQPLLIVAHGYLKQGHLITIAVAEDISPVNAGLRQFQIIHGAISIGILVALLSFQYLIVTRALRPLQKIRNDIQRLGRGEAQQVDTSGPTEIVPLVVELNRLLIAMSRKTRRSREAMGNLAHSLKTQLALMNQTVERPDLDEHPELRATIQEVGSTMHHIVERELKRARLMGATLPGRHINLQQEIGGLVQTLQSMYADKALEIKWSVSPGASFIGDQEDVMELLGNLLDNACKWGRKNVRLEIKDDTGITFIVEDDGPGCRPEEIPALTGRGFRLDESKPGSGLGLAIVSDIVESYGGQLEFGASPLGGLSVRVSLPQTAYIDMTHK